MKQMIFSLCAGIILLWTLSAQAFDEPLVTPSVSDLSTLAYARVSGTVDTMDATVFHMSVTLTDGVKGLLSGGDRFGMTGFWFNTTFPLRPEWLFLNPHNSYWRVQLNNPNCPGGCRSGEDTRVSGFGEYQHRLTWRGPVNDRPSELHMSIETNRNLVEDDFRVLAQPKPESSAVGHFVIYLDGFKLLVGSREIQGTFVRD